MHDNEKPMFYSCTKAHGASVDIQFMPELRDEYARVEKYIHKSYQCYRVKSTGASLKLSNRKPQTSLLP
jgi:hypothetical protein